MKEADADEEDKTKSHYEDESEVEEAEEGENEEIAKDRPNELEIEYSLDGLEANEAKEANKVPKSSSLVSYIKLVFLKISLFFYF